MAFRFNKRVKIAPGVKLNLSKSGVSTSVGGKGASVNIGKKGAHLNASVPGTGLSARKKLTKTKKSEPIMPRNSGKAEADVVNNEKRTTPIAAFLVVLLFGVLVGLLLA